MMPSILIVDDDAQIRKLLNRILIREGFTTVEASHGKEALKRFDEQSINLVITDIIMPEKEGVETISELKKKNKDIKIIAISGGGRLGPGNYLNIAMQLGACLTLEKPLDKEKLLLAVNRALRTQ